jgi:hypothetical protein
MRLRYIASVLVRPCCAEAGMALYLSARAVLTGMIAKNVLRAVSLDVTGTLLRYRGHIGDIYGIAPTR